MNLSKTSNVTELKFSLIPFTKEHLYTVEGFIFIKDNILRCNVNILGPIESLKIKNTSLSPQRREGIWHSTCFEVFLSSTKGTAYTEWNFCPSSDWWVMDFSSYRNRIENSNIDERKPENLQWSLVNPEQLTCHFGISLPQNISRDSLRIGLTSILENKAGIKTYWSLVHLHENPDFHASESFLITTDTNSIFDRNK